MQECYWVINILSYTDIVEITNTMSKTLYSNQGFLEVC
jgi:hypothetical protein